MLSFGDKLRQEREKRAITLEQISLTTKIGTRMLQALEEEKFNQLPGGIFNKGFVRAYARHLGLDEDQAVADYLEASGEGLPASIEPDSESPSVPIEASAETPARDLPWGMFAAILLVIALVLSIWSFLKREHRVHSTPATPAATEVQNPAPQSASEVPALTPTTSNTSLSPSSSVTPASAPSQPPTSTATPAVVKEKEKEKEVKVEEKKVATPAPVTKTATPTPVASTAATPVSSVSSSSTHPASVPAAATPVKSGPLALAVNIRQDSWISITVDGKLVTSGTLKAGSQRVVQGRKEVVVKAGNAGGVEFVFNGKKLGPQGETSQVKTLTFNPDGLQPTPPPPPVQE